MATSDEKFCVRIEARLQTCAESGWEGVMMLLSEDTTYYPDAPKGAEKFWRR